MEQTFDKRPAVYRRVKKNKIKREEMILVSFLMAFGDIKIYFQPTCIWILFYKLQLVLFKVKGLTWANDHLIEFHLIEIVIFQLIEISLIT